MAVRKKGLDYFPMSVDVFDDFKIADLMDIYGPTGLAVFIYVLAKIYKDDGYYLEVAPSKLATFAVRTIGNKWTNKQEVIDIIEYCGSVGLLDDEKLAENVLTSVGIQTRFAEITKRRVNKDRKHWILSATESPDSVTETPESVTERGLSATEQGENVAGEPQSKVKQSKGKYTKRSVCGGSAGLTAPTAYGPPDKNCPICGGDGWIIEWSAESKTHVSRPCTCRKGVE